MLLPMLAEWLCANNGKDARATRMVRDMHLFLIPTMNPDGFAKRRRKNRGGKDLNRNFPDRIKHAGTDLRLRQKGTQPETWAVMQFMLGKTWAGAANFHEGAEVAVYPWDGYASGTLSAAGGASDAPDSATFKFLAQTYADAHTTMSTSGGEV
ncbi:hypothetical protein MNEG_3742 [Monoraphidium neglectum]|uniref:Peptidase M14 domain-containing protein n=1 Tax=Monoraphidium neglectum TaxID=145388 RepID=A0A0D2MNE5_9CHLO|nr:hypothetical protein MNEG_3742 [Monoraphidium neglectum]KIZ04215.1 hypothetical protein MNEG_3742 [Monoraphidium neglectum]|eukprot:XP_013903234.1 hypothetical protein MNEG_3742 [Monoraphidium neglectum]